MPKSGPFTEEQERWIIKEYSKLMTPTLVRRKFRLEFKICPFKLPNRSTFFKLFEKFMATGSVHHLKPSGRKVSKVTEDNIILVRQMVEANPKVSIRQISSQLDISTQTAWVIIRKKLKMFPYKPKTTQPLTLQHKKQRIAFSDWVIQKSPEFMDNVIWSDEKLWEEKVRPNRQNERYWGLVDPEVEVDCRVQGGKKVMCWGAVINGEIILHWFPLNTSVNQHVYLDMLKSVLWPAVRGVSSRRSYYFQQDGATAHTTNMVLEWLKNKFGDRVISRNTAQPWPAKSPDMSPLDFWFWSVCLTELRRSPPNSLEELKNTVNDFADRLTREEVIKSARDLHIRAKCCKEAKGGAFEFKLKKYKRDLNNEE